MTHYREDALVGEGMNYLYPREYSNPNSTKEYFLESIETPTLTCIEIVGMTFLPFNRHFPNAQFVGEDVFHGEKVWLWNDTWTLQPYGKLESKVYVSQDTGRFFGWEMPAGASYAYHQWSELASFPPNFFTPPNIPCIPFQ